MRELLYLILSWPIEAFPWSLIPAIGAGLVARVGAVVWAEHRG